MDFTATALRVQAMTQSFQYLETYVTKVEEMLQARHHLNQCLRAMYDQQLYGYLAKWLPEFFDFHDNSKALIEQNIRNLRHVIAADKKFTEGALPSLRAKMEKVEHLQQQANEAANKHKKYITTHEAEKDAPKHAEKLDKLREGMETTAATSTVAQTHIINEVRTVQEQHISHFCPSLRHLVKLTEATFCDTKKKRSSLNVLTQHLSEYLDMNSPYVLATEELTRGRSRSCDNTASPPKVRPNLLAVRRNFFTSSSQLEEEHLKGGAARKAPTANAITDKLSQSAEMDYYKDIYASLSLPSVLENAVTIRYFHEFTKRRRCDENVMFWMEVEDFKKCLFKDDKENKNREFAAGICDKYLKNGSNLELNIDDDIRSSIFPQLVTPDREMFAPAQASAVKLMDEVYMQFTTSPEFKRMQIELARKELIPMDFPQGVGAPRTTARPFAK